MSTRTNGFGERGTVFHDSRLELRMARPILQVSAIRLDFVGILALPFREQLLKNALCGAGRIGVDLVVHPHPPPPRDKIAQHPLARPEPAADFRRRRGLAVLRRLLVQREVHPFGQFRRRPDADFCAVDLDGIATLLQISDAQDFAVEIFLERHESERTAHLVRHREGKRLFRACEHVRIRAVGIAFNLIHAALRVLCLENFVEHDRMPQRTGMDAVEPCRRSAHETCGRIFLLHVRVDGRHCPLQIDTCRLVLRRPRADMIRKNRKPVVADNVRGLPVHKASLVVG